MPDKPVPARVDAAVKQGLLDLADYATSQDWPAPKTCEVLGLSQQRQRRWRRRQEGGEALGDGRSGASINALMPCEAEAIVDAFETFADKDFFHRAHLGSYDGLFWVSTSTVRRGLNDHDLRFRHPPRPSGSKRRPFPVWATYRPNSTWIHDSTHFTACGMTVLIIEDLVSRKWITHVETHLQVRLALSRPWRPRGPAHLRAGAR